LCSDIDVVATLASNS